MKESVEKPDAAHGFDPRQLADDLVAHGLIQPSGVPGVFGRGAVFEDVLERFNALVTRTTAQDGAERLSFPPVMSRRVLERVQYFESFPHLCGAVHSFMGTDQQAKTLAARVHDGTPWSDLLSMTDVALVPAACYPIYPTLTGTVPAAGRLLTAFSWVYRHEPSPEPTRLQSFRIREFVRVGSPTQVVDWRDQWIERGLALLTALGLPVSSDAASDPFFGRAGKMLAVGQKQQRLKVELVVPVISAEQPTAICSYNLHQDHFGSTFDIRLPNGDPAHTACMGFGLERIVMALLKTHGFDPAAWPASVRRQLWP